MGKREEILAEIRRVAEKLGVKQLPSSLSERLPCKPDLWYTVYLLG